MLKNNVPAIWQRMDRKQAINVTCIIALLIYSTCLTYAVVKQKPFYVVRVENGESTLLIDDADINLPQFKELNKFAQKFIIALMAVDSKYIDQRLDLAYSMMSTELLDEHRKNGFTQEVIDSVKSLKLATHLYFENINILENNTTDFVLQLSGKIHSGNRVDDSDKITFRDEKRFISKISIAFTQRTKSNPSGLMVTHFEYKTFLLNGEEIIR